MIDCKAIASRIKEELKPSKLTVLYFDTEILDKVVYEEDDHICETDEDTIWLYIYSKGFMYYESCYPDDTEEERKGYKEKKHFYLPTQKRLDEANGEDWY